MPIDQNTAERLIGIYEKRFGRLPDAHDLQVLRLGHGIGEPDDHISWPQYERICGIVDAAKSDEESQDTDAYATQILEVLGLKTPGE